MFAGVFAVLHIAVIFLFGFCAEYDNTISGQYSMFQDVHVMIFIGFGFLMAFLMKNSFTTTGHSLLVAAFTVLWAMLNDGFWHQLLDSHHGSWTKVPINLDAMVKGDFAAGAVLISFGAIVGRASAPQLLVMAFFEVIFYSLNEAILVKQMYVADIGGSMVIHAFGAYFGLAVSFVLEHGNTKRREIVKKSENKTSVESDTMAMIGTLLLWCFWPSFNSYFASSQAHAQRPVINTYLSIVSSAIAAFYVCAFMYKGKFRMVEVQNSTLAGGVAIGACADMIVHPYGAIIVGSIAGAVSVIGYRFISPILEKKTGLLDTCGVHNLHGMPGVIGALTSVIVARMADGEDYGASMSVVFSRRQVGSDRTSHHQANYQLASLGFTLLISLLGGAITGGIIRFANLNELSEYYHDKVEWTEVPGEEEEEEEKEFDELKKVVATEPLQEEEMKPTEEPAVSDKVKLAAAAAIGNVMAAMAPSKDEEENNKKEE